MSGVQKPQGGGTWRRRERMVSSVREEEDQGDCGGSPGPGQGAVMSHAGQSSFGGGWGGLQWDGEVRG